MRHLKIVNVNVKDVILEDVIWNICPKGLFENEGLVIFGTQTVKILINKQLFNNI